VEGTATVPREPDAMREEPRFTSRRARLSYQPLPGLVLQFSRGTWSRIDQLVAEGQIRRTSLSATYTRNLTGGEWLTTLAWGRNAPRGGTSLNGYLAETSVRLAGVHTAFARFEQVGSGPLYDPDTPFRMAAKVNKLSLGYYQDMYQRGANRIGLGVVASRHLLSSAQEASIGRDPSSVMFFMRLRMH
ncbi:MAG TPA: hypothetical protein VM406_15665, partial [Noviherbaspirillum sp.]|nr:hypothetical protein [Noviherbaspirillum sp.]